jgi:hypothetical protein
MRCALLVSLSIATMSLSAHAAPPVPDPRLEQSYNMFVVPNIQRSVEFERTLPQPVQRPRPAVNEQNMKQMADGLFVERSLLPRGGTEDEPGVIRVYPNSSTGASRPKTE